MAPDYKSQSQKTARYYDEYQQGYSDIYGDMIQAFRPSDTEELMQTIVSGADIRSGLKILDAGCGTGGPAVWLAIKYQINIDGLTISEVQASKSAESINSHKVNDKVKIKAGDYHELSQLYEKETYDRALFLESLGHSGDVKTVISEAYKVLKPGGLIYIKDFYYKESDNEDQRLRIKNTIDNINQFYSYNTLNLTKTLQSLREVGFEIDFIRRFSFRDDISIRFNFEKHFGIDIFGGEPEFTPAEWLEIRCIKPLV